MKFFKSYANQPTHPDCAFIHSPELDKGGYPTSCPFDTRRAGKTLKTVRGMGLLNKSYLREVAPVALREEELLGFHTPEYLAALRDAQEGKHSLEALSMGLGNADCPVFRGMYDYVRLAAGGTLTGARLILDGAATIVFNPSGGFHHAQPGAAAGFCYLNDIVVAALELLRAGKRVLFLDLDVHHCDGVQDAFYDRDDLMTISMHEDGQTLFPGTGAVTEIGTDRGTGYTANLPLPVGTYDGIYKTAFLQAVLPLIQAYDPDILLVEIGMDVLAGDPLAHLSLTNNTPAEIIDRLLPLGKPILATGGGGYNVTHTVRGWSLCWSVLAGEHSSVHDASVGTGGVLLENTDWVGGLKDRVMLSDGGRRPQIDEAVHRTLQTLRETVFPYHGL